MQVCPRSTVIDPAGLGYFSTHLHSVTSLIDFKPLIDNFRQIRTAASQLETPNIEDHLRIRLAMVGFSQSADIAQWDHEHFQFVQNRLDTDLSPADFSEIWIDFACAAMGYLLGLVASGRIKTDSEFFVADAQLPGFMWMHSGEIEQLSVDSDGT